LAYEILLASTPISGTAGAAAIPNSLHHEWGLLGAVVGGLTVLASALFGVATAKHQDVKAASLALEQSASVMFIRLILAESKRVFEKADDHLPLALSQSRSSSPQPSRFDHFCKAIRSIPEEELDDRGRYTDVIRESFTRIISENAERLLDAMSAAGTSPANPTLNPTGVRFSLEADGYLRFAQISQFDSQNRRLVCWFERLWLVAGVACGLALASLLPSIVAVLPEDKWGQTAGIWSLWATVSFVAAGIIATIMAFLVRHLILRRSAKHGDPAEAQQHLDQRRRRGKEGD
jgi:hypothetical protein